jgi:acyl-coenzyme A synthetase/AMP-(fatty) acid ligase
MKLFNEIGSIHDFKENKFFSSEKLSELIKKKINIFLNNNINKGDNVIVAHGNNHLFFCDLLALWNIGACCIPVDPGVSINELQNLIKHSHSKIIICKGSISLDSLKKKLLDDIKILDTEKNETDFKTVEIGYYSFSLDDNALMLYTSGSTGEPKGVLHTHRSFSNKMFSLKENLDLNDFSVSLNLLPTHFGHGLICNCLFPLLNGQTLVILPSFSIDILSNLGNIIDRYKITFMSSVPAVWKIATHQSEKPKNSTLKRIHCGSAPLGLDLIKKIKQWSNISKIINAYGITETGSWIAGSEHNEENNEDGYIGKGWGAEFIITKENNDEIIYKNKKFTRCIENELGYVWVKTASLMKEYYKRDDLTKEFIFNTWFFTGDKGFLDANDNLYLRGRVRNEINKGGIKIMPEDIDIQLEKNENVLEACAFGVDDRISGQNVNVAIVLKNDSKLGEVKSWLKGNISSYKLPAKWFVLNSIPKTERGKVNRKNVAQYCHRNKK